MKKPGKIRAETGRPPIDMDVVLPKLIEYFKLDATNEEACRYAGIGITTFHRYLNEDEAFRKEIESAQDYPLMLAKKAVLVSIRNGVETNQDKSDIGLKFLERRQRDRYSPKVINEIEGGLAVTYEEFEGKTTKAQSPEDAKSQAQ